MDANELDVEDVVRRIKEFSSTFDFVIELLDKSIAGNPSIVEWEKGRKSILEIMQNSYKSKFVDILKECPECNMQITGSVCNCKEAEVV